MVGPSKLRKPCLWGRRAGWRRQASAESVVREAAWARGACGFRVQRPEHELCPQPTLSPGPVTQPVEASVPLKIKWGHGFPACLTGLL